MKNMMKNKFFASLASLALVISAVLLLNFMSTNSDAASLPRDCDNNSIVYCGVTTPAELKAAYKANKTGDLPAVYSHYGISASMIDSVTDANLGQINKDGTVVLNGKTLATGASSIGRQNIYTPSTKLVINGKTYYQHIPKNTFAVNSIKAWIFTDKNGRFLAAILTSCGNPFTATPPPAPKPTYQCDSLTASQPITRTSFTFTAKASGTNGATVASYNYNFGDGTTASAKGSSVTHTYTKDGTYTVTMTANISVDGKTVVTPAVSACSVKVTVTPVPATPTYQCDSLVASESITRTTFNFTAKASGKDGATVESYNYTFGDGTTAPAKGNTTSHTYTKDGTYTATVTANVSVNGKTVVTPAVAACSVKVTVTPAPAASCNALDAKVLKSEDNSFTYTLGYTAKNGAALTNAHFDFGDKKTQDYTVAQLANITHAYDAAGTYTVTATLTFSGIDASAVQNGTCTTEITISPEMCTILPSVPKNDVRCTPCTVPGKETLPKESLECVTPPVTPPTTPTPTPTELPHTGTSDMIGGSIGLGSIIAAGSYWFASRRNLLSALLNR